MKNTVYNVQQDTVGRGVETTSASSEFPWSFASLMALITIDLKAHLNEDKPNFVP